MEKEKFKVAASQNLTTIIRKRILTEFVVLSSLRMPLSISTVEAHLVSPAARQSTATHLAIEHRACLARPPD